VIVAGVLFWRSRREKVARLDVDFDTHEHGPFPVRQTPKDKS
jgi:hypothetical protein